MSPKVVEATLCSGKNCGDGYQLIHPTIAPFRVFLSVAKPIKNDMGGYMQDSWFKVANCL